MQSTVASLTIARTESNCSPKPLPTLMRRGGFGSHQPDSRPGSLGLARAASPGGVPWRSGRREGADGSRSAGRHSRRGESAVKAAGRPAAGASSCRVISEFSVHGGALVQCLPESARRSAPGNARDRRGLAFRGDQHLGDLIGFANSQREQPGTASAEGVFLLRAVGRDRPDTARLHDPRPRMRRPRRYGGPLGTAGPAICPAQRDPHRVRGQHPGVVVHPLVAAASRLRLTAETTRTAEPAQWPHPHRCAVRPLRVPAGRYGVIAMAKAPAPALITVSAVLVAVRIGTTPRLLLT